MELTPQIPQQDQAAFLAAQKRVQLENQLKAGAGWFYWIGGLSLLNTLIVFFGGSISFVVGLGLTQIIDAIPSILAEEFGPDAATTAKWIGLALTVVISGVFALFGYFSRKQIRWVFILGMVLYTLDLLILIWATDIAGILFHALALFGLYKGFQAIKLLKAFEKPSVFS